MWRGFFLAVGITLCVLGGECLVVDRVVWADTSPMPPQSSIGGYPQGPGVAASRDFKPPEWAPWTLLTGGAVVILYSFSIHKRVSGS